MQMKAADVVRAGLRQPAREAYSPLCPSLRNVIKKLDVLLQGLCEVAQRRAPASIGAKKVAQAFGHFVAGDACSDAHL